MTTFPVSSCVWWSDRHWDVVLNWIVFDVAWMVVVVMRHPIVVLAMVAVVDYSPH